MASSLPDHRPCIEIISCGYMVTSSQFGGADKGTTRSHNKVVNVLRLSKKERQKIITALCLVVYHCIELVPGLVA
jgi:hypothetical protein